MTESKEEDRRKNEVLDNLARARKLRASLYGRFKSSAVRSKKKQPTGDPWSSAADYVESIDHSLPDELLELGSLAHSFSNYVSDHTAALLGPTQDMFQAYVALAEWAIDRCVEAWRRPSGPWRKVDRIMRIARRSVAASQETFLLLGEGFPDGARSRLRTVLELATVARVLEMSPVAISERYGVDHIAEAWRRYRKGDYQGVISATDEALLIKIWSVDSGKTSLSLRDGLAPCTRDPHRCRL